MSQLAIIQYMTRNVEPIFENRTNKNCAPSPLVLSMHRGKQREWGDVARLFATLELSSAFDSLTLDIACVVSQISSCSTL